MSKKLTRNTRLLAIWAWVYVLEVFAFFYCPLRAGWMFVWHTWTRFWCAVRLYCYQDYRWGAAWRTASYVMEDVE